MRNTYTIENYTFENNKLIFILNENNEDIQFQPAGQVIVDSDDFAFIYLVDTGDAYGYLRFPPNVWPQLVQILEQQQDPTLQFGEQTVVLQSFYEELQNLMLNIEGNNNYGQPFTDAVEKVFANILANT